MIWINWFSLNRRSKFLSAFYYNFRNLVIFNFNMVVNQWARSRIFTFMIKYYIEKFISCKNIPVECFRYWILWYNNCEFNHCAGSWSFRLDGYVPNNSRIRTRWCILYMDNAKRTIHLDKVKYMENSIRNTPLTTRTVKFLMRYKGTITETLFLTTTKMWTILRA